MGEQFISQSISSRDLEEFVKYFEGQLTEEAEQYLTNRGITKDTIQAFRIGFEKAHIGFQAGKSNISGYFINHLIFPIIGPNGEVLDIIGRNIQEGKEPKYKALIGREDVLFNMKALAGSDDIILCRNIFDVLSLEQVQLPAVSLPQTVIFKESHKKYFVGKRVFICFSNDDMGRRESRRIAQGLDSVAKEVYILPLPQGIKDINHLFIQAQNPLNIFIEIINQTIQDHLSVPVVPDVKHLTVFFEEYLKRYTGKNMGVLTGFDGLDQMLGGGIKEGLYILQGTVSSGKSMFLRQMAEQIAGQRIPVMYVTWDMTTFELWSRSIARILKISPQQILTGKINPQDIGKANKTYGEMAKYLWTVEGNMDTTLEEVEHYLERIAHTIGKPPVIFIDHLHRVPIKTTDSKWVENPYMVMYILHHWSRQWNIPIIVAVTRNTDKEDKGFSYLEASADVIFSLDRVSESDEEREEILIRLDKHRNGTLGKVSFAFDKEKAIFYELNKEISSH
ncbi:DNA primase [Microaerobacter geothermalis]|uniref:DnaB-like helicase C-terminal domain-containing protein n=1 Tax=Microaerobacter geothermalis TaxID=674972 RepID=UPI001F2050DC|nr:DnaB-like helicase C-terminal domain-containing protein [Microaerobacter geothermalis]MCF6093512.1 DNA primase [Microaerobacter geothermalis]